MKKIYFAVMIIVFSFSLLKAQQGNMMQNHKKIETQRVVFITQSLDLSPEEAQQFWPIYNEMQKKIQVIHNDMRKMNKSFRKNNNELFSDKEIVAKCDSILSFEKMQLDIKIEYFRKYKKILPPKKLIKFMNIERDFNKRLLNKISRHKGVLKYK